MLQEREQKAMGSSQKALELQQLAAGSGSILESSQLSAAAQQCTAEAEIAAQVASLARAEAERLSCNGPSPGPSANSPAPGTFANSPAPGSQSIAATAESHMPGNVAESGPASLPAASAVATAAANESQLGTHVQPDSASTEHTELSRTSMEFIRGLSSDMQAAMQQLVANVQCSSSVASVQAQPESPSWAEPVSQQPATATGYGTRQGLSGVWASDLGVSTSSQMSDLPNQTRWHIPSIDTASTSWQGVTSGMPALPDQATEEDARDAGPSGMQLHLVHQLEGLERSVRRVEQQVSSTKETRRRLKTAYVPAQVICSPCMHVQVIHLE